jgi:transposase
LYIFWFIGEVTLLSFLDNLGNYCPYFRGINVLNYPRFSGQQVKIQKTKLEKIVTQQYSKEFKVEAVRLSYEEGQGISKTARDLSISKSALYRWRVEYGKDPGAAFPGKGKMTDKDAEIAQLKRALKEAQMEAEILKKATAIFAKTNR